MQDKNRQWKTYQQKRKRMKVPPLYAGVTSTSAQCCQQGNDSLNIKNKLGYTFLVLSNGKQAICYI
jgi:hypothetical protein